MIYGIGHDVVEIARIQSMLKGSLKDKFLKRILTPKEWSYLTERSKRQEEFTAGRFAVKEAVSKAFGCGIGYHLSFQDIEVLPNELGKPECSLAERVTENLKLDFEPIIHVSISHERTIASAYVVIEKR